MIKANELRIGNYVTYHGGENGDMPCKLDGEDIMMIETNPKYAGSHSPIPLSPEILEKCGWVKKVVADNPVWENESCTIMMVCKKGNDLVFVNNLLPPLKSLHQLQNLYFALTGTEIEL